MMDQVRVHRRSRQMNPDHSYRWSGNLFPPSVRGKPVVEQLLPEDDDYFVLKPKHSAFFQTNLRDPAQIIFGSEYAHLDGNCRRYLRPIQRNDAYMRDFRIIVPPDCSTSENPDQNRQVLMLMQRVLKAEITPSTEITFDGTRVPRGSQFRLP